MGLSQEELAQLTGVSRQSVTKWETGQSAPDLDRLVELADVLGVSLDFLLRGPQRVSSPSSSPSSFIAADSPPLVDECPPGVSGIPQETAPSLTGAGSAVAAESIAFCGQFSPFATGLLYAKTFSLSTYRTVRFY